MLVLAITAMACRGSQPSPDRVEPGDEAPSVIATPDPEVVPSPGAELPAVTAERLREHVEVLADDRLRGRPTPSPQLDEAASYIADQFRELGLSAPPDAPGFLQRFECGGDAHPGPASNVLAVLPGRDPEWTDQTVIVSAHYDHIGEQGTDEDTIFNGANDNASGVAGMLAIAEALAASPPRRSVLFAAFCGEELGLRGSYHYADHPVRPLEHTVADVNLEMLGRPTPDDPAVVWIPGMERSELGDWLIAANARGPVRFVDAHQIGPIEGQAFDRSDNFPLALRGVVAHSVSTGHLDALYHSPDDEADTLDYEVMAVLVQAIAAGVHRLAEAPGQPGWIEPPQ